MGRTAVRPCSIIGVLGWQADPGIFHGGIGVVSKFSDFALAILPERPICAELQSYGLVSPISCRAVSTSARPESASVLRRVVVTGMGAITPVGLDVETSWRAVVEGRSGIGPITLVPVNDLAVKIAGEVKGFDPSTVMEAKEVRRADRFSHFAVAAAREAVAHAGLVIDDRNRNEIGVIIGSGAGGIQTYTDNQHVMYRRGPGRLNPLMIPMITADSASVQVSIQNGCPRCHFWRSGCLCDGK